MKIYGFEKFSMVDFDGHFCATIFTGACNFCCPFCHNSGLVKSLPKEISLSEIFEYLQKRKGVIDSVCVSGGEPTIHPDLPELLHTLKEFGLLIKLDTNGTNYEMLKNLIDSKLIDYVAMDVKNALSSYSKTIGKKDFDTTNIEKSISLLKENKIPYEFRCTLVDSLHTEKDIVEMGKLLMGARVFYLQQFTDHGTCIESNLKAVDKTTALEYKSILEKTIDKVLLRGY